MSLYNVGRADPENSFAVGNGPLGVKTERFKVCVTLEIVTWYWGYVRLTYVQLVRRATGSWATGNDRWTLGITYYQV